MKIETEGVVLPSIHCRMLFRLFLLCFYLPRHIYHLKIRTVFVEFDVEEPIWLTGNKSCFRESSKFKSWQVFIRQLLGKIYGGTDQMSAKVKSRDDPVRIHPTFHNPDLIAPYVVGCQRYSRIRFVSGVNFPRILFFGLLRNWHHRGVSQNCVKVAWIS